MSERKWSVAGMAGIVNPVIITQQLIYVEDEEVEKMMVEIEAVMKKHGFEIGEISNNYYFERAREKAKVIDSLKTILRD